MANMLTDPNTALAFLPNIGGWEMAGLLVIALLLFGKRLPEVGRSLGKGIVEFRKGIQGLQDEVEQEVSKPATSPSSPAPSAATPTSTTPTHTPPASPSTPPPAPGSEVNEPQPAAEPTADSPKN